jgi:hypothetical protein
VSCSYPVAVFDFSPHSLERFCCNFVLAVPCIGNSIAVKAQPFLRKFTRAEQLRFPPNCCRNFAVIHSYLPVSSGAFAHTSHSLSLHDRDHFCEVTAGAEKVSTWSSFYRAVARICTVYCTAVVCLFQRFSTTFTHQSLVLTHTIPEDLQHIPRPSGDIFTWRSAEIS